MTIARINPLERHRIPQKDVVVTLQRSASGIESCMVSIPTWPGPIKSEDGSYFSRISRDHQIWLTMTDVSVHRVALGTVGNPAFGVSHPLNDITLDDPSMVLKIVDPQDGRICADCDGLRAGAGGAGRVGRGSGTSLLPLCGSESLDGRPWIVRYTAADAGGETPGPVLYIDKILCDGSAGGFLSENGVYRALVLPAVAERILLDVCRSRHVWSNHSSDWRDKWLTWAGSFCQHPSCLSEPDRSQEDYHVLSAWVDSVVTAFSSKARLITESRVGREGNIA